ncbi:putative elongator complex protein 1 [Coemansia sp. RSA 1722]|nr:putative elongator complex protein 1 [Coemansia sp. RSA 486]KAJ2238029.1 putative elongator complex protein 1 [Coemansia sp. RSA 485]KAJ2603612.1 putative elongator complex protein 1 [Coemansia sp. RSA 1721]KAJ2606213.1 putative elongator complex protein 1 [Coemansia sp. RSA 1722]KAJ2639663.1 putative elongator complex protein 1 [Coemansia sp. RSA 1286]
MRNLTLLSETTVAVPDNHHVLASWSPSGARTLGGPSAALCVDVTENKAYVLLANDSTSDSVYLFSVTDGAMHPVAELPLSASHTHLAHMHYLMERESVFVATQSGDILLVETGTGSVQLVGTVDPGILGCEWSPDGEVLAVVTNEAKLLLMTQEFDVLEEFALARDEHGEQQPVALGWGTKETQYHGKAGKQQAEDKVVAAGLSSDDDLHVRISWRGDGDFFAVSFVTQGTRELRVFARDGKLHSVAERIRMLEHLVAWKPSGRLVAATEKLEHKHSVVFFERNGLRHGDFDLRKNTRKVVQLAWNADSTVLAILAIIVHDDGVEQPVVELWTDKNYHWYMKQEIRSSVFGDWISHVIWDPESPLRLHVVGRSRYACVQMHTDTDVQSVASDASNAAACVVDNDRILYTPFALANVPPPMALHSVQVAGALAHVAFAGFGAGDAFAALLADRRTVVLFDVEGREKPAEMKRAVFPQHAMVRQVAWPWSHVVAGLARDGRRLFVLDIDGGFTTEVAVPGDRQATLLTWAPHAQTLLVQADDGHVWRMADPLDPCLYPVAGVKLPVACVQIDAADVDGHLVVVGLTNRSQLFANNRLISSVCSSFYLRRDLLLYTTTAHHQLCIVPVDSDLDVDQVMEDSVMQYDESRRRIERGATIVLASPTGDSVVFQMPRGNLETVRPRALVLAVVRRLLDARRYRDALLACRVNRIDMNIVHDHCPQQLVDDLPELVRQVQDPDVLNLFVTGLRDEDVTATMYSGLKKTNKNMEGSADAHKDKATRLCRLLRPVLQQVEDSAKFMPTVLTTFVCQQPADIAAALRLLAPLAKDERDRALTYLLFLSDVDTVYDAALGLYDLPLALLVAQRSQRDPREYLAALGVLNKMESDAYRKFRIDQQLGRNELALGHLCEAYQEDCTLWQELVEFVQESELYALAMKLLANVDQKRFCEMSELFGDYQAASKPALWAQAAASFMLAGNTSKAISAFVQAKDWRSAMVLACDSSSDVQLVHDVAVKASAVLSDSHLFMDAATVLLEYTEEHEDAVALLVRGSHWAEAIRVALLRDRQDLVETTVRPGLSAAYDVLVDDVTEIFEAVAAKCDRLREVRAKPLDLIVEQQTLPDDPSLDNIDVMSDTTSMASKFSTFTGTATNMSRVTGSTARRISKNKRKKEERRKVRGKKGSVYEESYLVDSVSKLIDRVRANQQAVREMSWALIRSGLVVKAADLQERFEKLVDYVLGNESFVFDQQRVQMRLTENGVPEPMPMVVNEFGVASQPRHPKPAMPGYNWRYEALSACREQK